MKQVQQSKFMHPNFKAITDGLFACGVLNDYRADWALVNIFEQTEMNSNTIQRNSG
jgi:hypothetical protein